MMGNQKPSISWLLYFLPMLYISNKSLHNEKIIISRTMALLLYMIPTLICIALTADFSTGRLVIFNGDPNYSSIIIISPLIVLYNLFRHDGYRHFITCIMFFVVLLVGSRMALIGVFLFVIIEEINLSDKLKLRLSYLMLILSFLVPSILHYIFEISGGNIIEYSSQNRLFVLNDESNFDRYKLYISAIDFLSGDIRGFLSGTPLDIYFSKSSATLIPHNWILLITLQYGVFYTLAVLISLMVYINKKATSSTVFIIFCASVLGAMPLSVPILFIFFSLNVISCIEDCHVE